MLFRRHSEYPAETGFKARHTKWKYDRYGRPVEQREYVAGGDSAIILHLTRRGIVDKALTQEITGGLDDISMGYTGNRLTTVTASTEALPFEGRTGLAQTGSYSLTYDDAGNLKSDPSRGISDITYNHLGRPLKIEFSSGNTHSYLRDNLGNVLSINYSEVLTRPLSDKTYIHLYGKETFHGDGQRTRTNGGLSLDGMPPEAVMTTFQGGYFDAKGRPRYYVNDFQGNIVAVIDHRGTKVQSSSYYPYGELHRDCIEPLDVDTTGMGQSRQGLAASGLLPGGGIGDWPVILPIGSFMPILSDATQPYHYSGKELLIVDGLREYDYHARRHNPLVPHFTTMDPKAESYPHLSPYAHCAANPIMFIDPTGEAWYSYIEVIYNVVEDMFEFNTRIAYTDCTKEEFEKKNICAYWGLGASYIGDIYVEFAGFYNECLGDDGTLDGPGAVCADVTVYGPNGPDDMKHYTGLTMSSDFVKYGAIDNGTYKVTYDAQGKSGQIKSHYAVNGRDPVPCLYGKNNYYPNPAACSETEKDGIFIHRTNMDGTARGVSVGCLLIPASQWSSFERQIGRNGFVLKLWRR